MISRSAAAARFRDARRRRVGRAAQPRRPVDLAHLARQTLGDRGARAGGAAAVRAAGAVGARPDRRCGPGERLRLAHGLKGSARGVGAFAIADCVAEIEKQPEDRQLLKTLSTLIDEVRDFIAAISR